MDLASPEMEKATTASHSMPQVCESSLPNCPVTPMKPGFLLQRHDDTEFAEVTASTPKKRPIPDSINSTPIKRRAKHRGFIVNLPVVAHFNGRSLDRFPQTKEEWIAGGIDPLTFKSEAANAYVDALFATVNAKIDRIYNLMASILENGLSAAAKRYFATETGITQWTSPTAEYHKLHELAKIMARPFADEKIEIVEESEDGVEKRVQLKWAQRMKEYQGTVQDYNLKLKALFDKVTAIETKIVETLREIMQSERERDRKLERITRRCHEEIDDFIDEMRQLFNDAEREEDEQMCKDYVSLQEARKDDSSLPDV